MLLRLLRLLLRLLRLLRLLLLLQLLLLVLLLLLLLLRLLRLRLLLLRLLLLMMMITIMEQPVYVMSSCTQSAPYLGANVQLLQHCKLTEPLWQGPIKVVVGQVDLPQRAKPPKYVWHGAGDPIVACGQICKGHIHVMATHQAAMVRAGE